MDVASFLKQINKLPGYRDQIAHIEHLAARRAQGRTPLTSRRPGR